MTTAALPYESPTIKQVGSLHDVTLVAPKEVGAADGETFMGVDIGGLGTIS